MSRISGSLVATDYLRMAFVLLGALAACQLDQLIVPGSPGKLIVSPPALDDSVVVGSSSALSRSLAIQADGTDSVVSWKASTVAKSPWLTLRTLAANAPSTLGLSITPGSLAVGTYQDTVLVSPDGWEDGAVRIPVTLTVRQPTILLAFTTQPGTTKAGSAISPAVQVTARDAAGKTVTSWSGSVTLSLAANLAGGTLSGTLTVNAVNGVARFTNLMIDRAGLGYSLKASSGTASATSSTFTVTPKS